MRKQNKTIENQNQIVFDAKIKIENILRRLRKLNVNLDFIQSAEFSISEPPHKTYLRNLHSELTFALESLNELTPTKSNVSYQEVDFTEAIKPPKRVITLKPINEILAEFQQKSSNYFWNKQKPK